MTSAQLFPAPRKFRPLDGCFRIPAPDGFDVCWTGFSSPDVLPAKQAFDTLFGSRLPRHTFADARHKVAFRFRRGRVLGPQSFRLRIRPDGARVEAEDRAGLFYAVQALRSLCAGKAADRMPCLTAEDAPDFPVRGLMLDVSRDKVPTMRTLFTLIDLLASLRYNQLQLYIEHTFAYPGHEEIWQNASPFTPEEIRVLDAYCAARCIELVPNQNSFGHLERWLAHPRYRPLAELPGGGAPLPWGGTRAYCSALCPTDSRSLDFLCGLYDAFLPNFSSCRFNVGCDETFDLCGKGRSFAPGSPGEGKDTGRVYLDFLKQVHHLVTERGREMMCWGDIILHHPELVPELPEGLTVLEWGYEANHPFEEHTQLFRKSGVPFYVCPGTSSWRSLFGRHTNMIANIESAARHGRDNGAAGFLLTDWGDEGHWQPLAVSYPAYLYAGAVSWCAETNRRFDLCATLCRFCPIGYERELLRLADLYRLFPPIGNASPLFNALRFNKPLAPSPAFQRAYRRFLERPEAGTETQAYLRKLLKLAATPAEYRWSKSERAATETLFRHIWLNENRPGGLSDSLAKLIPRSNERLR